MSLFELDEAVTRTRVQLAQRGAAAPDALLLLGTGSGALPPGFSPIWRTPLEVIEGVPLSWRGTGLTVAEAGDGVWWLFEDAPGDAPSGNQREDHEPPWERGFPCWLAADAGARVLVHTSGGMALPVSGGTARPVVEGEASEPRAEAGGLALVSDHLNLSAGSPLVGLGESRLGPLFPDTTRLHHAGLRAAASRRARALGLACVDAVCACTAGPALDTRAERLYYARAGAGVAVQGLVDPLLAAAHAGLACLALVCLTGSDEDDTIQRQIAWAEHLAPRLDELLGALAPDVVRAARELTEERG